MNARKLVISHSPLSCRPGRRSPVARVLAGLLAVLLLPLPYGLLNPQPVAAQALGSFGGFLEISQAFFGEGGRTFGAGEVITVSGVVPYIPVCPGMYAANPGSTSGRGEGRFDFFPVADLYVIPDYKAPLPLFFPLHDVNGSPNRVTGTGSGAFVDEVVGVTNPAGNLGAGRYAVVMDQCLDGVYDPGIDIVLGDGPSLGFEVVLPGPIQPINLHPVKQAASNYSLALDGMTINVPGANPVVIPGFCKLFGKMVGQANLDSASLLASWTDVAKHGCGDLIAHYKGIANDPPDPHFTQFAELGNLQYNFAAASTPLERIMRDMAHVLSEQAAASQALLTSLERFQGAQVAGNDEYMMLQLEEANKFINLLVTNGGSLLRLYALLESFERELPNDPMGALPEAAEFRAYFPEMRRAIASLFLPLGPQFKRLPANQVPDLIPSGLQSWIIVYLEKDPFLKVLPGLSGIPSDRTARGLPPISFSHPNSASLGPFATPPGRSYGFDASKSSDPNGDTLTYTWDFDGDGQFNDGTGAIVSHTFAEAGARLVAVKATDTAGNTDVSYAQLNVGDVNVQDVIVMSNREEMYRVSPDGTVNTLRPALPIISNVGTLHVDVNGDIWVSKPSPSVSYLNNARLEHYDSNGSLLSTITRQQVENLVGFGILNFRDFVFDGRGDIILSVQENLGPGMLEFLDFPQLNQFIGVIGGRLKVLRLAKDGSRASVIAEVGQDYYQSEIRNGQLVVSNFASGPGGSGASLAINPQGQIVVGAVNNLIWPKHGNGIFTLDPDTGVMTEVIPPTRQIDPFGQFAFPVQHMLFGLAGIPMPPWGGLNAAARSNSPGIEVDINGSYYTGRSSAGSLRLSRTPIPPKITPDTSLGIINLWVLETFPLSLANPGTPSLLNSDMALDSGGDVIVAGTDASFPTLFPPGVYRVTPLGQFSQVAVIPVGAGGFGSPQVLDVVPSVRKVAQNDLPPLPQFKLETLRVSQQSCPGGADLSVSVTNTGSVDITSPVRVYFYDGDPEGDGVVIGSAEAAAPIAPGVSVTISSPWQNPAAGIHQIYAGAVGFGSTTAHSFMVCVPTPAAGQDAIQLTPPTASANLGSSHTVTATVLDIYGNGIAGVPISFDVSGANTATGNATTNASGIATFTYAGNNSGQDAIVASFPNGGASNSVTQDWTGAATDTTPPVLSVPANITVEAASSSGAVVNYSASANDAVDGPITPVCALVSGSTFPLGQTTVNCTATDAANNSASSFFDVFVLDTTPPTLSPHANINVPATNSGGAAVNYTAPTASDTADANPTVACAPVSGSLFPLGTTTVNCTATDFSGNQATSFFDVFVQVGTPRIAGTLVGRGSDALGNRYFEVRLSNTGTGHARNLKISQLLLRTLAGSGTVTYLPALSGALPMSIGSLDVSASSTIRLYLSVPATVTRFSITESGTVQNVVGTQFSYSTAQSVIP